MEDVDFEPEEETMEEGADTQQQSRRGGGGGGKSKGRGRHASMDDERYSGRDGVFESLDNESGTGARTM